MKHAIACSKNTGGTCGGWSPSPEMEFGMHTAITVAVETAQEAAAAMRELGYRRTSDLRWTAKGISVDVLLARFRLTPTLCRLKTGHVLSNAFYWTAEQEREIARCSVELLREQIAQIEEGLANPDAVRIGPVPVEVGKFGWRRSRPRGTAPR